MARKLGSASAQKVTLARAVLLGSDRAVDEPVEHLDAANADLLRDLLALNSGIMSAMRPRAATHRLPNDIQCAELSIAMDRDARRRRGTNSSDNNTNASAKT